MRPIKLEVQGLHSFESNQIIDFNALSAENVFGIFGQTGSGKSTILDAIVLSLYGKVQRSKTNSDFINIKSKKAEIKFNFSFFVDGENKEFLVVRSFKRKAKNETEVDQVAEVYEVSAFGTRLIAEGASKVNQYLINLLGITEGEFLKCVALPQGEFAAFLKAKPNERISIMGNIFDLNKYGDELWEKVRTRCDKLETEVAVTEGKLSVLGSVDASEIVLLEEALNEKNNEIEKCEKELEVVVSTEKEEREIVGLLNELDEVCLKITECKEVADSISYKKEALNKAKKLKDNEFIISKNSELTSLLMSENDEIHRLNEQISSEGERLEIFQIEVSEEELELEKEIENGIRNLGSLEHALPLKDEVDNLKKETAELKLEKGILESNIENLNKKLINKKLDKSILNSKIGELNGKIEEIRSKLLSYDGLASYTALNEFNEELKKYKAYLEEKHADSVLMMSSAINSIDNFEKEQNEIATKIKSLQNEYGLKPSVKESTLYIEKDRLNKEYIRFAELKSATQSKLNLQIKLAKNLKKLEEDKNKKQQEKLELDRKYKDLYEDLIIFKNSLNSLIEERNKTLSEQSLSLVIRDLKIGDSCPICNNEVLEKNREISIDDVVVDNDIDALKKNIEIKEEKKESLVYKTARVISDIENIDAEIASINVELDKIGTEVDKLFYSYAGKKVVDYELSLKEIESDILSKLLKVTEDEKKEKKMLQTLLGVQNSIIKNNVLSFVSRENTSVFSELLSSVNNSIKNKDVEMLGILSQGEDLTLKLKDMKRLNEEIDLMLKKNEDNAKDLDLLQNEILRLETEIASSMERSKNTETNLQKCLTNLTIKQNELNSLVNGDLLEAINLVKVDLENKKFRRNQIREILKERLENISEQKTKLTKLVVLNKSHMEEYEKVSEEMRAIFESINITNIEDAKPFILSGEEILTLENSISQYETKYSHYAKRKEEIEARLSGRVSAGGIIDQLSLEVVSLTRKINTLKEERVKLSVELEAKKEKLSEINKLSKVLEVETKSFGDAKDLYNAIKGKALLEYIAEEFIDDISFMASSKMQILMDGRYELVYKEREFFVIDNFNDGKVRPVATLSGGEMFVVSLALALSISDAIVAKSNKTFNFFFLDEGFGTLDKEYCEFVVDSLLKISSPTLTIGLISHIPELQDRISQKIYITKTENGSVVKNISSL